MVGLIQKILLDMVEAEGGPEALAATCEAAGVPPDTPFRINVDYDDAACRRLFDAAAVHLGRSEPELMDLYADYFCRDALERWPVWFEMSANAREFLERQPVIDNGFARGLAGAGDHPAVRNKFCPAEGPDDELVIHYRSPNRFSPLYVALAGWVLRHYGEKADITVRPLPGEEDFPGEAVEICIRWDSGPGAEGRQIDNSHLLEHEPPAVVVRP
jgi:hypothetical protein